MDDLKDFRQLDSVTPGHPENFVTAGIEVSTGPLGQGISNAVGMAMAERHLAATFNKPDFKASEKRISKVFVVCAGSLGGYTIVHIYIYHGTLGVLCIDAET